MANEATVRSSLKILKTDSTTGRVLLDASPKPTAFTVDVAGTKGPVPGAVNVTTAGVNIDFSELTTPALCRIMNFDSTNFLEYGIWDPEGGTFYPLGEVGPGETYVIKLSRNLQEEFGTGTGTSGANTNRLRLKADTAAVEATVEAFEV